MSYYDDPWGEEYDPSLDPNLNMSMGDPQTAALIEMMLAQGQYADPSINAPAYDMGQMQSLVGLVPDYQMSGKPLTVANQTAAMNAWRSNLFDPAMAGFGGADAFAADAFAPTQTVEMEQSPELQTIYGYLRRPRSVEGIIANELMSGGTPSTAVRNLRQLFTLEPQAISDQMGIPLDEVDQFKKDLLIELPAESLGQGAGYAEVKDDGTGVDWEGAEFGVRGLAAQVYEDWSAMPLIGPTGPQFDPKTGMQISSGGERRWEFDETGAPIMVKVTTRESPLTEKYHALGLPTPMEEYTQQDFMNPDQIAMQEAYAAMEDPVAALKQAWMDPSLAPSNEYTPQRPQEAIPNLTDDQLAGRSVTAAGEPRYNFPTGLNAPGGDVVNAPGPGDVQTTAAQLLPHDPGATTEFMQRVYPTLDRATQDALVSYLVDSGQGDLVPAQPRSVMEQGGQALAAPDILPEDPGAIDEWMRNVYPTLARGDQDAIDAYMATSQGGVPAGGGPAGQSIGVNELMRRRAAGYDTDEPAPPGGALDDYLNNYSGPPAGLTPGSVLTQAGPGVVPPSGPSGNPVAEALNLFVNAGQQTPALPVNYPAGDAATYEQFLAENPPLGPPRTPAYARPGAQPANQPGGPGFQNPQIIEAMLAQVLPGNQQRTMNQPPDWPQQQLPSGQVQQTGPTGREDWMRAQTVTGAGGGRGSNAMPATPYWAAGGVGQAAMTDALLRQLLPGDRQRSTSLPPGAQRGATPANQPGGPAYMEAIETGERRAQQRAEDEQQASVLGGTTDRTGRRVRPTRTGEQARQYRAAFDEWDRATDEQQRLRQASHTFETGQAMGQAWKLRQQGVTPLSQTLMARRLTLMGAGMPSSGYLPGT